MRTQGLAMDGMYDEKLEQKVLSEDMVMKRKRWFGWGRPLVGVVLASSDDGDPELFGEHEEDGPMTGYAEVSWLRNSAAHERAAFAQPQMERLRSLEVLDRAFMPGDHVSLRSSGESALVEHVDRRMDVQLMNGFTFSNLSAQLLRPARSPCPGAFVFAYSWIGRVIAVHDMVRLLLDDGSRCAVHNPTPETFGFHEGFPAHDGCPYVPGHHVHIDSLESLPAGHVHWLEGKPNHQHIAVVEDVKASFVEVVWLAGLSHADNESLNSRNKPSSTLPTEEVCVLPLGTDTGWRGGDWGMLRRDLKREAQARHVQSDFWKPAKSSFAGWSFDNVFDTACLCSKTSCNIRIRLQNGNGCCTVRSTQCLPTVSHSASALFPGHWVEENSESLAGRHGVVKAVDTDAQTADVTWMDIERKTQRSVETMSLYDLQPHGEWFCKIHDVAVKPSNARGADRPAIGLVLRHHKEDGKVDILWDDGGQTTNEPGEISLFDSSMIPLDETAMDISTEADESDAEESDEIDRGSRNSSASYGMSDSSDEEGSKDNDDLQLIINNWQPIIRLHPERNNDKSPHDDDMGQSVEVAEEIGDLLQAPKTDDGSANADSRVASFQLSSELPSDLPAQQQDFQLNNQRRWQKAWRREMQQLQEGAAGIHAVCFEQRTDVLRAAVQGGSGTPYEYMFCFFTITLGNDFPDSPPDVQFDARGHGAVNPNLYANGKVCLSLLGTWNSSESSERWQPFYSNILQVLLSIQALVLHSLPYVNEPGFTGEQASEEGKHKAERYNEGVYLSMLRLMLAQLKKPLGGCESLTRELYKEQREKILEKADMLAEETSGSEGFRISLRNLLPKLRSELNNL